MESDIGGWLLQMFKLKNSEGCVISEQEDTLAQFYFVAFPSNIMYWNTFLFTRLSIGIAC